MVSCLCVSKLQVWARHLLDKSVAVALLNRGTGIANITVTWDMIGVPTGTS